MLPTKYGFKMQTDVTETQGSGSVPAYMVSGASGKEKYVTSLREYSRLSSAQKTAYLMGGEVVSWLGD